jgi:hypothetical protein
MDYPTINKKRLIVAGLLLGLISVVQGVAQKGELSFNRNKAMLAQRHSTQLGQV